MRRVRAVYGGRIVKFVRKQHDRVCGGSNYAEVCDTYYIFDVV